MNGNNRWSQPNRESPLGDIGDFWDVWIAESAVDMALKKPHEHRERWANFVLPTLQDPGEVWLQERMYRRRKTYRCVFLTKFPGIGIFFLGAYAERKLRLDALEFLSIAERGRGQQAPGRLAAVSQARTPWRLTWKSRRSEGFARTPRDTLSAIYMRVAGLAGPFDEFKSFSSAPPAAHRQNTGFNNAPKPDFAAQTATIARLSPPLKAARYFVNRCPYRTDCLHGGARIEQSPCFALRARRMTGWALLTAGSERLREGFIFAVM